MLCALVTWIVLWQVGPAEARKAHDPKVMRAVVAEALLALVQRPSTTNPLMTCFPNMSSVLGLSMPLRPACCPLSVGKEPDSCLHASSTGRGMHQAQVVA